MQDFAEALARFARGELKHGDLFDLAEQQNATGRLDPAQTASTLDTLLRQGQLSTADYLSIKDYIGHITRQRGGDDDATVLHTPAPSPGEILKNRFVLETVIGRGGMGTIFKARDLRKEEAQDKDPFVAVKVLNPSFRDDPDALVIFQREAKKAQTLAHPNIATVYDFDRDGATIFLTMEWLKGQSLADFLKDKSGTGVPVEEAVPLIRGMAAALGYAHSKQIVHLDFKPANAFLLQDHSVKVLDFGIARAIKQPEHQTHDATTFILSKWEAMTPAYASPEMFEKQSPDPCDDIYALACVSYELLSGKHPYQRMPGLQARQLGLTPESIPNLNERQNAALRRALALTREARTPSIEAFLAEFEPPDNAGFTDAALAQPAKGGITKTLAGLAVAALIGVGSYLFLMRQAPAPQADIALLATNSASAALTPDPAPSAAETAIVSAKPLLAEEQATLALSTPDTTTIETTDTLRDSPGDTAALARLSTDAPVETDSPDDVRPPPTDTSVSGQTRLPSPEARTDTTSATAMREIDALQNRFEQHLRNWELTSGRGGNAVGILREMESRFADMPPALDFVRQGYERVAEAYLSLARNAYNNGQYTKARGFVSKGNEIKADERFAQLEAEIDRAGAPPATRSSRASGARVFSPDCDLDELERQFSLGGDLSDLPPECLRR